MTTERRDRGQLPPPVRQGDSTTFTARVASTAEMYYPTGVEYRDADEVKRFVKALPGAVVTLNHPDAMMLDGADAKIVGVCDSAEFEQGLNGEPSFAVAQLRITDPETLDAIASGTHGISLGYTVDELRKDATGRSKQIGVNLDHIAVVYSPRCTQCKLRADAEGARTDCGCKVKQDYSPDQERDEHGRFGSGGGSGTAPNSDPHEHDLERARPELFKNAPVHAAHTGLGFSDLTPDEHKRYMAGGTSFAEIIAARESATKPKREPLPTYSQARENAMNGLAEKGWKVARRSANGSMAALKTPHATSPDGATRLYFKPQAVHFTHGNQHTAGDARSIHTYEGPHSDLRKMSAADIVERVTTVTGHKHDGADCGCAGTGLAQCKTCAKLQTVAIKGDAFPPKKPKAASAVAPAPDADNEETETDDPSAETSEGEDPTAPEGVDSPDESADPSAPADPNADPDADAAPDPGAQPLPAANPNAPAGSTPVAPNAPAAPAPGAPVAPGVPNPNAIDGDGTRDGEALTDGDRAKLAAETFAVPAREGLPINNAQHVRASMARFGTYPFTTVDEKHAAYNRIMSRAKQFGVDATGFVNAWSMKLDRSDTRSKEYMDELKKMTARADKAERLLDEARALAASEKARADKAEATIETVRKDAATVQSAAVKARVALETQANGILGAGDRSAMSDRDLRCAVIKHVDGLDVPAAESNDYVRAYFDSAVGRATRGDAALATVRAVVETNRVDAAVPHTDSDDEATAKASMLAATTSAWKTRNTKGAK